MKVPIYMVLMPDDQRCRHSTTAASANIQTRYLIASEIWMSTLEPASAAPLARRGRVCLGRSNVCGFSMWQESLRHLRVSSDATNLEGTNGLGRLSEGKRRLRVWPTFDRGFGVFNGKRACRARGCE